MPAVQFFGIDAVLDAADNLDCPAWGIFIGRNMFSKFEGTDMTESLSMLQNNLTMLQNSDSNTVYTLKFFEASKDKPVKVNEKTTCDGGSFNFKLVDPHERQQRMIGNATSYDTRKLEERILQLEKEKKEAAEEEPETIGSIIKDLLKNPSELAQLVNIGRAAIGLPIQNMGAIGSTRIGAGGENATAEVMTDSQLLELGDVVTELQSHDPKLLAHMKQLLAMAKDRPAEFNMATSMLEAKK